MGATEVLVFLAWATMAAEMPRAASLLVTRCAAAGCWALSIVGLWLTWHGLNIKAPSLTIGLLLAATLLPIVAAAIGVFLAPLKSMRQACITGDKGRHYPCADRADRSAGG